MQLATNNVPGGSRLAIISLYGSNRPSPIVDWQRKVFNHFNIALNQIDCPFPVQSHGFFLDRVVERTLDQWDYLMTFDMDAIPLKSDAIEIALEKVRDGRTVFGGAQQSNHISVNGTVQHVYVSPCFLAISRNLYEKLGRPSFNHNQRGDCAEEITWRAKEQGYNVGLVYPSSVVDRCYPLDNGLSFGWGTVYGDLAYHGYCQGREGSEQMFIDKCKETLTRYGAPQPLSISSL